MNWQKKLLETEKKFDFAIKRLIKTNVCIKYTISKSQTNLKNLNNNNLY